MSIDARFVNTCRCYFLGFTLNNVSLQKGEDTLEMVLMIDRVSAQMFRNYYFVAQNSFGKSVHKVYLERGMSIKQWEYFFANLVFRSVHHSWFEAFIFDAYTTFSWTILQRLIYRDKWIDCLICNVYLLKAFN